MMMSTNPAHSQQLKVPRLLWSAAAVFALLTLEAQGESAVLVRGKRGTQSPSQDLSFWLSTEMKTLNVPLEEHKRCAFDFLQANIDREAYQTFTCHFKGMSMESGSFKELWGCGYNLDLEEAAKLYKSDGYLSYQTDAIDDLQNYFSASDVDEEKKKQWTEFQGYWQNFYICEFRLTNVMRFLELERGKPRTEEQLVAYKQQRCALDYFQYHMKGQAIYKDFSCEYRNKSPGCADNFLDLEVAASEYLPKDEKPYQKEALDRLQEQVKSKDPGLWSKFIKYWRKEDECIFVSATGKLKIVHLGDSYSAGNGARGPEEANQPINCHRNMNSWGYQVKQKLQDTGCHVEYINKACHGATTPSIEKQTIMKVHKKYFSGLLDLVTNQEDVIAAMEADCKSFNTKEMKEAQYKNFPSLDGHPLAYCIGTVDAQIGNINHSVDVVLLTIGGNDLGFSSVVEECMVYNDDCGCEMLLHKAREMLESREIKTKIKNVFKALRGKMRKDARIIYSTYPHLVLEDSKKKFTCDDEKHEFYAKSTKKEFDIVPIVRDMENTFEEIQAEAVMECNADDNENYIIFYRGTKGVFDGKEPSPKAFWQMPSGVLRDDLYLHDFGVIDLYDDFVQNSAFEVFEAYHPNVKGHAAWADGLFKTLRPQFDGFCLNAKLNAEFNYFKTSLDLAIVFETPDYLISAIDQQEQLMLSLNKIFDGLQAKTSDFRVGVVSCEGVDDRSPEIIQHFTNDIEEVRKTFQGLVVRGSPLEYPAYFAGINDALDGLSWRDGAVKLLMVIGDKPLDLDMSKELPTEFVSQITADELIKASWELDPVQIVTVDLGSMNSDGVMAAISSATGGMNLDLDSAGALGAYADLIVDKVTQQPFAWIGTSYVGRVGETIKFDARGSYDPIGTSIVSYIWDFEGDGVEDQTTIEPQVDHVYDTPFDGFVYLSAVGSNGLVGLASARVKIYDETFVFEDTLPECEMDETGLPIIFGEGGVELACVIKDSMVFMKVDPEFVKACDECLDELEGSEEAVMLRNAYDAGNATEFGTILCDLVASPDEEIEEEGRGGGLRKLKKRGKAKVNPKQQKKGTKKVSKKGLRQGSKQGSENDLKQGLESSVENGLENESKTLLTASPCEALVNGAVVCPKGIVV